MRVAIVAAMAEEIEALLLALGDYQVFDYGPLRVYKALFQGVELWVVQSGIAKVNAAVSVAYVLQNFAPDFVINIGSAGGVSEAVSIGDVVLGACVAHHDVDVRAFGYDYGQVPNLPNFYKPSEALLASAMEAATVFDAPVHQGLIVSGDCFVNGGEVLARIVGHFPEVLAVEMEAAAIAQCCFLYACDCVVVRAISDHANSSSSHDFKAFVRRAGAHSARMALDLIIRRLA